jgi:hypothetical protein
MNKIELATGSNTPPEVLAKLAYDEKRIVRWHVAQNPNTSVEVLERLANDEDYCVRFNVVYNHNTQPEVLEKLANDNYFGAAYNPNTPKYIKTYLKYQRYLKCYEQI